MHVHACLCAGLPRLALRTRVELVMHRRERGKPTATGELALACLVHGAVHVQGLPEAPADLAHLDTVSRRLLVLFPSEEARPLTPELLDEDPRPVTLVVPDGSWRQASRIARRVPGLEGAERVTLPAGPPTTYRLRREPKEGGLATAEAIARALGVIEGAEVQEALEAVFDRQVTACLDARQPPSPTPRGGAPRSGRGDGR